MSDSNALTQLVGQTDIYLLDQIQKNRFQPEMHILDAGCGTGRNLYYFLKEGFTVHGADTSPEAIAQTIGLKNSLQSPLPDGHFQVAPLDELPWEDESMDAVLCIAVLHFAKDPEHFRMMIEEMWRLLKPGGTFFCRLASSIGIESRITPLQDSRYLLPDGTKRFLVTETMLLRQTHALGASFLEPIKTVNVQNSRCMTTWVLKK